MSEHPAAVSRVPDPVGADDELGSHGRTPDSQTANAFLRGLTTAENALITLLLIATVAVILAQVLFRYAFDRSLSWSNEIATGLLVYVSFVGFAIGVRDNAHVSLQLFENRLGSRGRTALRAFELLVLGAVLVAIGVGGAIYAWEHHDERSPIDIPLWVPFVALPLGGLLGAVHVAVHLTALLRSARAGSGDDRTVVGDRMLNDKGATA